MTTQHERDLETDFDYRGARFMDAEYGRFLSVDPLASDYASWSTYNYVLGNPVMFVDPDGRSADWVPKVDDEGNISYVSEDFDSYSTLIAQYGKEAAENLFHSSGNGAIDKSSIFFAGDVSLKSDTHLKLNVLKTSDEKLANQMLFAIRNERIKDRSATKVEDKDFTIDLKEYFSHFSGKNDGGAGLSTSFSKMTSVSDDKGNTMDLKIIMRGGHDGLIGTSGTNRTQNGTMDRTEFYHKDKPSRNAIPVLNIYNQNNQTKVLYDFLKLN